MMNQAGEKADAKPSLFQNWISLVGIVLSACAFFAVLFLIAMDLMRGAADQKPPPRAGQSTGAPIPAASATTANTKAPAASNFNTRRTLATFGKK